MGMAFLFQVISIICDSARRYTTFHFLRVRLPHAAADSHKTAAFSGLLRFFDICIDEKAAALRFDTRSQANIYFRAHAYRLATTSGISLPHYNIFFAAETFTLSLISGRRYYYAGVSMLSKVYLRLSTDPCLRRPLCICFLSAWPPRSEYRKAPGTDICAAYALFS